MISLLLVLKNHMHILLFHLMILVILIHFVTWRKGKSFFYTLDIDDTEAFHPMVMVMSSSHVIKSKYGSTVQNEICHDQEICITNSHFVSPPSESKHFLS